MIDHGDVYGSSAQRPRRLRHGDSPSSPETWDLSAKAPDLTKSIMGRLGYMRSDPRVARRRRVRRWLNRISFAFTIAMAFAIGAKFYVSSNQVSPSAVPAISDALYHDLEFQRSRIGTMIRTIQNLAPVKGDVAPRQPAQPQLYENPNHSRAAVMRWV